LRLRYIYRKRVRSLNGSGPFCLANEEGKITKLKN
jgi:hypothetical protein